MQDSNYYSRQMSYYEEKIEEAKKEKTNYETLHAILKQLLNGLPDIKSDLVEAENCFKNGGYVDSNGTFDKGKLNESYSNLENVIQNINNVITKTLNKITLIDKDIINYRNSYESANVNYRKARSSELGEK